MKTQYTKGPWKFYYDDKRDNYQIFADGIWIAITKGEACSKSQEANAKLIAAAPALLEVLERLVACPDVNADMLSPETIKAAELARELISKVKGDL